MKKIIFTSVMVFISVVVMIGWTWLPDSATYINKSDNPNVYTPFCNTWAWIGVITMITLSIYGIFNISEKIYDYLRK